MAAAATLPFSGWADAQLQAIARLGGAAEIAALSGETLLGERAALNSFTIPGRVSAGGGCRLFDASGGHVALNLSRPDDRGMLAALFGDATIDPDDDEMIATRFRSEDAAPIVARGRMLGLAMATIDEVPVSPATMMTARGGPARQSRHPPLVIDLSALWAGPLATSILRLAGAEVVKVESRSRPDSMRDGDPGLFALLNQGKASVALDLASPAGRDALITLTRRAQIIVAASRPRALRQLGIDADTLVREVPGLVWITITGHGISGDAADWAGFGDDCGVAGGASAALRDATGMIGFVGDACADPLTGIHAARIALTQLYRREGAHLVLSMSGIVAEALTAERHAGSLTRALQHWSETEGRPFPAIVPRRPGAVAAFGADNDRWLGASPTC
ncbi:CoA transferase [Sphingomonas oligophenolica]|uniref:CoA transferase n=1 Tax=Sphingomonas oligophenolica TaxID=301154 RepID=A0ABU9XY91_9SPHN